MKEKPKTVPNISVQEYLQREDNSEFRLVELYIKPENKFMKKSCDLSNIKFGEVMRLRDILTHSSVENMIEVFEIFYKVNETDFMRASVIDFFKAYRFVVKYIENLNDTEESLFQTNQNKEELDLYKMAGGNSLKPFREFATLINLGRSFGKSPEEVSEWTYHSVLNILLYDFRKALVDRNYEKLIKQNNA